MGSETTAASAGEVGVVRRDPMAMLPFCGYHIGDYFRHWLRMGSAAAKAPKIFSVNWFRKGPDGKFVWPGFGQNMRVLEWVVERCQGQAGGVETPLGLAPRYGDLNWQGIDFGQHKFAQVMSIDGSTWNKELASHEQLFQEGRRQATRILRVQREQLGAVWENNQAA
jgi:phosphoenolpyruvate carboxykinase (GTP)